MFNSILKNCVFKPSVDTKKWLKGATVRAVKTFAQSMASLITVGATISEINWGYIASVSVVSAVYSIVTSVAGIPEAKEE
jgi:hypothetical protein